LTVRFQADADLKHAIVKAVRKLEPAVDFASSADAGLEDIGDPELLERSAQQGRILVSHDRRTMVAYFRSRLEAGKSSPGLFIVSQGGPVGPVARTIVLAWAASEPGSGATRYTIWRRWRDTCLAVDQYAIGRRATQPVDD
jgi:hypothetical protein